MNKYLRQYKTLLKKRRRNLQQINQFIKEKSLDKAIEIIYRFNKTSRLSLKDFPFVTMIDNIPKIDFHALSHYFEDIYLEENFKWDG